MALTSGLSDSNSRTLIFLLSGSCFVGICSDTDGCLIKPSLMRYNSSNTFDFSDKDHLQVVVAKLDHESLQRQFNDAQWCESVFILKTVRIVLENDGT